MLTRKSNDNVTMLECLENGWVAIPKEYELMVRAFLDFVEKQLEINFWNKNQKEFTSPFANTGESYKNNYVTIRAYGWDENKLPNFDTDELKISWYKHSNRGVYAIVKKDANVDEVLVSVLNNTVSSLGEDFKAEIQ